jgi:hypothetical protein
LKKKNCDVGNTVWLVGLDAPIVEKHILKCQNKLEKYLDIHLHHGEKTFSMTGVKTIFCVTK